MKTHVFSLVYHKINIHLYFSSFNRAFLPKTLSTLMQKHIPNHKKGKILI